MKKDAYYFPHDTNARNDERILFLRYKYGLSAYAIYFLIVEIMHEQSDGKLSYRLLDGLCQQINVDKTLLHDFYNDCIECGLFKTDGEKYWSERVLRNKTHFEKVKNDKSKAGSKGMESRWGKQEDNTVITPLYQSNNNDITEHNKGKERKRKERKENKIKDLNTLTCTAEQKKSEVGSASKPNFQEIVDYFNSRRNNLPEIKIITKQRQQHISARIKEYGEEAVYKVIDNTNSSNFLNGENGNGWLASFDWIMSPGNFIKVLEGNYANKAKTQPKSRFEENVDVYQAWLDKHAGEDEDYDA